MRRFPLPKESYRMMDMVRYMAARQLSTERACDMTYEVAKQLCVVAHVTREVVSIRRAEDALANGQRTNQSDAILRVLRKEKWKRRMESLRSQRVSNVDSMASRMALAASMLQVHGILLTKQLMGKNNPNSNTVSFSQLARVCNTDVAPTIAYRPGSWDEPSMKDAINKTLDLISKPANTNVTDKEVENLCIYSSFHVGTGDYMPCHMWACA